MKDILRTVNWMSRDEIVGLLEGFGFVCYDHETTDELREALVVNVLDGTITKDNLPEK